MLYVKPSRAVPAPLIRRVAARSSALAVASALSLGGLALSARPAVADNTHPPHPPIVIDDFTTSQQAIAYPSPSNSASAQSTAMGSGILGGERYLHITANDDAHWWNKGYQGVGFFACINTNTSNCPATNAGPNQFVTFRQIGVSGSLTMTWDGTGNDPATLNPTGLGHVDLTSGGVRDALLLAIPYYNSGVNNLVVTAYTDATHASQISFATPGSMNGPVDPPVKEILKFADFSAIPGKNAATFTDIGAITISFNAGGGMGPYFSSVRTTDTVPPMLSLPANITTRTPNTNGTPVTFAASAVDAADGDVPVSCDHNSGDTFPIATTTVHCSSTDTEGNTSTGSFTITVTAGSPPDPGPTATPELGSGALLITGVLPLGLALLVRRRRTQRTLQE